MDSKTFALSIVVGGVIQSSLRTAAGEASKEVRKVGDAVRAAEGESQKAAQKVDDIEAINRRVTAYRQVGQEVTAAGRAHRDAQEKVKKLAGEMAAAEKPTKQMKADLAAARAEVKRAAEAVEKKQVALKAMSADLRKAGVDTSKLGAEQRRLATDLTAAKTKAEEAAKAVTKVGDALAQVEKLTQKKAELGGALAGQAVKVGAVAMAMRPVVTEAGNLEHALKRFGQVANKNGGELETLRDQLRQMEVQTNQSKETLLAGLEVLVGKGMGYDEAVTAIGAIGKAATATGASVEDMSLLAFSVMDNLKVKAADLPAMLDAMAQAGKEGGFELRDMAKYFPMLTASAQDLGLKGPEAVASLAASLQIAMKGAADPSVAANNFSNFLAKITDPATIKHFANFGIDLKSAIDDGMAAGDNPVETVLKLIEQATDGDKFKISEIFGDMQVKQFLSPMLANMKEYEAIKNKSKGAKGVVDTDFAAMMETNKKAAEGLDIATARAGESLGKALLPVITPVVVGLGKVMVVAGDLIEAFPWLTTVVVGGAAAWTTYRSVAMMVGMVQTMLALRSAMAAVAVGGLAGAQNAAAASSARMGLASLLAGGRVAAMVPVVVGGLRAIAVAAMANPIGLVVGGIALAAGLIIAYWDEVSDFFMRIWEPVQPYWDSFITYVGKAVDTLLAPVRAVYDFFAGDDKPGGAAPVKAGGEPPPAAGAPAAKGAKKPAGTVVGGAVEAQDSKAAAAASQKPPVAAAAKAVAQAGGRGDLTINMPITLSGLGLSKDEVLALLKQFYDDVQRKAASQSRGALYDHG